MGETVYSIMKQLALDYMVPVEVRGSRHRTDHVNQSTRSQSESIVWMDGGNSLTVITESMAWMALKVTRKEIWKENIKDVNCRLCKTDKETVGHVLCGGLVLLRTQYYARHDAMMRVIYCKLLVIYGFETELIPWLRDDYVEKIKETSFESYFGILSSKLIFL